MWKRLLAMLTVSVLLATLCSVHYERKGLRTDGLYYQATGVRPDAQILTVNGQKVEAEEYFYWLDSVCEYLDSYVGGGLDFSTQVTEELTFNQYAKSDAATTVTLYHVVRQMAQEAGVTLTDEDLAALETQRQQYIDYYGGEDVYAQQLQVLGVSEELMRRVEEVPFLYNRIYQLYCDPGSRVYPGNEALESFGKEQGYVTVQLLYFPTADLDDSALADLQKQAEDYAARLSAADDKQTLYLQLATQLGLTVNEAGFTFCADEADPTVYQAVAALDSGEVSDVIVGASGYYVALGMETNYGALTEVLFNIYLQERQDSAKVEYNDKLYDALDAGAFYANLSELRYAAAQSLLAQG